MLPAPRCCTVCLSVSIWSLKYFDILINAWKQLSIHNKVLGFAILQSKWFTMKFGTIPIELLGKHRKNSRNNISLKDWFSFLVTKKNQISFSEAEAGKKTFQVANNRKYQSRSSLSCGRCTEPPIHSRLGSLDDANPLPMNKCTDPAPPRSMHKYYLFDNYFLSTYFVHWARNW